MERRHPIIGMAFSAYDLQLVQVADYIEAVSPAMLAKREAVPVFVESLTVLMVARFEHFLKSLFAHGVHQREEAVRKHFLRLEKGKPAEQARIAALDRGGLIQLVNSRVSFKGDGKGIGQMSRLLFDFSPWPDDAVNAVILDLVLLRNIFVHEGDRVLAAYAGQIRRVGIFTEKTYPGLPTIYTVDHVQALVLVLKASRALKKQVDYLRGELLSRPEWTTPR